MEDPMDGQEKAEFEKLLRKYEELAKDESLSPTHREKFEKMRDSLADALLQEWLLPAA